MSKPVPLAVVTHFAWLHRLDEHAAASALEGLGHFVESWSWQATQLDGLFAACQSPVERLFALGWTMRTDLGSIRSRGSKASFWDQLERLEIEAQPTCAVADGALHPDFTLRIGDPPHTSIYVEIDGHEFHCSTRQQVARDRQRERAIAGSGSVVIRFTGGEVTRDPNGCVEESVKILKKLSQKVAAA